MAESSPPPGADARRHSPAAQRNAGPILEVLRDWLPPAGDVLEVAAGSGEHAVLFARALPGLTWHPGDPDPDARRSIQAWREHEGVANVAEPLALDVRATPWPLERADAVVCINLLHISPWAATEALMAGAGRILGPGGRLLVYGPFRVDGAHTAESNTRFDRQLRAHDPSWGVRDSAEVTACAERNGLALVATCEMPANNRMLVYERGDGGDMNVQVDPPLSD